AEDAIERGPAALVHPVCVVDVGWTVDRDADQDVMLSKELAPLVVEQRAVGLNRVLHGLARLLQLVDQLNRSAVEVEAHTCRPTPPADELPRQVTRRGRTR